MNNVEAYKNYETDLASTLEAQYNFLILSERPEEACDVLGRLMAFKLIDRWDERLNKKYKPFKNAGIITENRFKYDLRTDSNYLPEWLFADIPYRFGTKLKSFGHMGQRVEGEYSCDTVFPDKDLDVEFRILNTSKSAQTAVENIAKLYLEETGKALNVRSLMEEVEVGFSRVYEISILNNVVNGYKVLGYLVMIKSLTDGKFYAKLALKFKVFKYLFVDIATAQRVFVAEINDALKMGDNLKVSAIMDSKKAAEEQTRMMREDRDKLIKYMNTKTAANAANATITKSVKGAKRATSATSMMGK